jgi:hypothetical protein
MLRIVLNMSDPLPETLSTTQLTRGRVLDRVLAAVEFHGARFTITRYRRPVACLGPVPARVVSDPNEVLAERMGNTSEKLAENSSDNSVTRRRR